MQPSSSDKSSSSTRAEGLKMDNSRRGTSTSNNTAKSSTSELAIAPLYTAPCSDSSTQHQCQLLFFRESVQLKRRSKSYSRTTRVLILISITYIVLNSLMAYSKLRLLFYPSSETNGLTFENSAENYPINESSDLNDELIDRIAFYLYYLNFSINFFLYVLNKSKFRDIFCEIFKKN